MSKSNLIYINGLGQISAVGQGLESLEFALTQNSRVAATKLLVDTAHGPVSVNALLAPEATLPSNLPESVKRRMARLSRMCFVSLGEALTDAFGQDLAELKLRPERIGLIVGTAFGCLDLANQYQKRVSQEGAAGASPSLFASSIHNSLAAHLSISFGLQGANSTITTMDQTAVGAFQLAADWLAQSYVDHVALVIGDEVSVYHSYFAAHSDCNLAPGEGVASFILSQTPNQPHARLADVYPRCLNPPSSEHYFANVYGSQDQLSQLRKWLGAHEPTSHLATFGSMVCGLGFEVLAAIVHLRTQPQPIACVQLSNDGGQAVIVTPVYTS